MEPGRWQITRCRFLVEGTFEVIATATDAAGNSGLDATSNELTIDIPDVTPPTVTIDALDTFDRSPELTGTIDDPTATIVVSVGGSDFGATNNGDGTWTLASGVIPDLNVGIFEVVVTATDPSLNEGMDATNNELRILPAATTASAATGVTTNGFTANWLAAGGGVNTYLLDVSDRPDFSQFVSVYDDFNTSGAISETITSLDYSAAFFYRVRVVYNSMDTSAYSNSIQVTTLTDPETANDSLALVSIYQNTDGENWTDNTNWLTGRLRSWAGITMNGTRVTTIDLNSNNLQGNFPELTGVLDQVTNLDVSNNEILTMGGIAGLDALSVLILSGNRLQFGSLESLVSVAPTVTVSPQKEILEAVLTLEEQGTTFVVDRTVTGTSNSYNWFRNGESFVNDGPTFEVDIQSFDDEGLFFVQVTNSLVPGLTLTTANVELRVSSLERDREALLNIFAALDGNNWTNGADWPNQDIVDWQGVTINNSRVTDLDLSGSNVQGDMPADITDVRSLQNIDLSNNSLTGLPDMTSLLNLLTLDVSSNLLDFGDLEPNAAISGINYDNQGAFALQAQPVNLERGSDFLLELSLGGSSNTYQWSVQGPVANGDLSGETNASIQINDISYDNMGDYTLRVQNSLVPGLTITSHPQTVNGITTINLFPTYINRLGADTPLDEGDGYLLKIGEQSQAFDSVQVVTVTPSGDLIFEDVILGDYLISIRTDTLLLRQVEGVIDSVELLPTYFESTFLWEEADTLRLRDEVSEDIFMQQQPRELTPEDGDGEVGLLVESDFDEEGVAGRLQVRRRVRRAGCSLRRRRRAGGGRVEQDEFELVAYKETDDEGRVTFDNLPPDTYRLNIEFPGIPMDTTSFIEFEVGANGMEQNTLTLEATVDEGGIAVEQVAALGFFRRYFKELDVFPNPADKELNIRYEKLLSTDVQVQILDLQGRILKEEEVRTGYNREMTMDVRDLNPGLYMLRFYDPESREHTIISYRILIAR